MGENETKEKRVDCFAFHGYKCEALYAKVPKDCEKCRFKKPKRDITDGKTYPYINYGSR